MKKILKKIREEKMLIEFYTCHRTVQNITPIIMDLNLCGIPHWHAVHYAS